MWVTLIAVVGFIAIVASAAALYGNMHNSQNSPSSNNVTPIATTSDTTPIATTSGTGSGVPSSSQVDSTAAANITGAQTAGGVDSNNQPTDVKSSFTVGNTVYVTFTTAGHAGYITMKVYRDGQFDVQPDTPITMNSGDNVGAFTITLNNPGQFVVGLYWCTQSDCSDAALGQVTNFTAS